MTHNLSQVINEGFVKGFAWEPPGLTVGWAGGDDGYWGEHHKRYPARTSILKGKSTSLRTFFRQETCWIDENGSGISGWTDGLIKSNQIKPNHIPNTKAHATLSTTSLEDQLGIFLRACIELLRWIRNQLWGEICLHFCGGERHHTIYILSIYFQAIWIQGYETHPLYNSSPGRFSLGQVYT